MKWCAVIASMVAALVAAAGAGAERMLVADLEVPGGTLRMVLRLTEGGDATIVRGTCSDGGTWKLKGKHDDGLLEVEFGALTCQITLGGAPVVLDFDLFVVDFGLAELIGQIAEVELRKH